MKEHVRKTVEYELMVRRTVSNSMIPIAIGFLLFLAGIVAIIPIPIQDGGFPIYGFYGIMNLAAMDMYMKMLMNVMEQGKAVNVFTKYTLVPVKKEFLIIGKRALLTRFISRCTVVFQLINLAVRLLAKFPLLCLEAWMPTLVMVVIYMIELLQLNSYANKLER